MDFVLELTSTKPRHVDILVPPFFAGSGCQIFSN